MFRLSGWLDPLKPPGLRVFFAARVSFAGECLSDFPEMRTGGKKRREALGVDHKRLLNCVNVNRTSLDHLLLGESADIDKVSNAPSITREGREGGWILFQSLLGVQTIL